MKFNGYRRPNGKVGIRNYVLILPTSICATKVAFDIANKVEGCRAVNNCYGCCQIGNDYQTTFDTLVNTGMNPNVGAVIIVALGCEGLEPLNVFEPLQATGIPVSVLVIQKEGGTVGAIRKGVEIANRYAQDLSKMVKEECDISELTLGMECGGSDTTSGLASNPAVGVASDMLLAEGGTSILSETTEFIGAEHILAKRAVDPTVGQRLIKIVKDCEERAKMQGQDLRGSQPTPGNIEGGLTSIEEKSLGCSHKAGSAPIQDILQYAAIPPGKGLYIMDTPGQDVVSITGMVAGGAQIIVFTTGRGTPTGNPLVPVIKVTGNRQTYEKMSDNIDLNVSTIIEGRKTIKEMGQSVFREIVDVANGKKTKAEELGHQEFSIYKTGITY